MEDGKRLRPGDSVFAEDGGLIGTVTGIDADGIHVAPSDNRILPTLETVDRVSGLGEIDIVWRCLQCGEVGAISAMPDVCPGCGAGREELYYWTED